MMKRTFLPVMVIVLLVLLLAGVLFIGQRNTLLVKERETLILQNDSLHILQLQFKKELVLVKHRLDSVLNNKGKNYSSLQ